MTPPAAGTAVSATATGTFDVGEWINYLLNLSNSYWFKALQVPSDRLSSSTTVHHHRKKTKQASLNRSKNLT